MAKIAVIGGGSAVFARTFLHDLFQTKALAGTTYCLMGRTPDRVTKVAAYAERLAEKNDVDANIVATTDREEALEGADYVIVTVSVGAADLKKTDKEIPKRYGVDQAIGDTLGPGGVFRAQRTIPVVLDIARDMERQCPNALLLNYANPMAMVCLALGRQSPVSFVGLCHGVQITLGLIAAYVGAPKEEIQFLCAGINHMAWFLELQRSGVDLYPTLRENIEKPEYFKSDRVRCEVMRHFGYFMTESTEHLSEYLPWFRKRPDLLTQFLGEESHGRRRPKLATARARELAQSPVDLLALESGDLDPRSAEYCSHIIEALETGVPFTFNGNVMNAGYIDNLPADACVEVPVVADREGPHPQRIGALPSPLAALNATNVRVQQLAAEAAVTGNPETLFAAVATDPLTAAVLSLRETRDMTADLLDSQQEILPQYRGRGLARHADIVVPEGTVGVETPIDPALATAHRLKAMFG